MTNRLSKESSPYLLQHAENPVDWFPWGEEAFDLARETDRPVLLLKCVVPFVCISLHECCYCF